MASKHRILVMSHGHPDFSLGGGELAAHALFQAYRGAAGVEEAWLLARVDRGRGATGAIGKRRGNEYLWEQGVTDWHTMRATNREAVTGVFAELLRALRPTVVHTHHYAHMGLEYLRMIKQCDPSIRICLTLHEYMAICRNNGQMLKTGSLALCHQESPDDCHRCFPQTTPEDFWLRKHAFLDHFSLVDQFVAPSEFLRQRYIAWGLPPGKITVIENGQSAEAALPARPLATGEGRNRFGFFGQLNPYKGIDVLLRAMHEMEPAELARVKVEIHGANFEQQLGTFQDKVRDLAAPLVAARALQWMGPYRHGEQRGRMGAIDWVVVPSIWWENSPMVIQEAFGSGRPVITSDIGGMAEKVRHGVDGMHVTAGGARQWAQALLAAGQPGAWERLAAGIRRPLTVGECAARHLALFKGRLTAGDSQT